jgi:hypothetical protein
MLDEAEFERWRDVFDRCIRDVESQRASKANGISEAELHRLFEPARALYSEITAAPETHHNEIWNHRRSNYGAPCPACGVPLRTPNATTCGECGTRSAS